MKRPVLWSRGALTDLRRSLEYQSDENPTMVRRMAGAIRKTGNDLSSLQTGRPGRIHGTYEKLVPRFPYLIVYALDVSAPRSVDILHVIHTPRDWPPDVAPPDIDD